MNAAIKETAKGVAGRVARTLGYDITHITRTVAYRAVDDRFDALGCDRLDALEIAAGGHNLLMSWSRYPECRS